MSSDARTLLTTATERLRAAGVPTPRVDAELLLADLVELPRSRLFALDEVDDVVAKRFEAAVARRAVREPLQHIVGRAPFRRIELFVGPGVFVPRPETELLVDAVLPQLRSRAQPLVVDLCAGSGALSLAIADEVPGARVVAVEADAAALEWLRRNAVGSAVEIRPADVRDPAALDDLTGAAAAVVANPPYVPRSTTVGPEVRADPDVAVFAGPDGLDVIPHVVARAAELLGPGGVVAIEHDDSHRKAVPALLEQDGRFEAVADHDDLTGRPRYVTARRRAGRIPGR